MGKKTQKRIILLIVLLLPTCFFVYRQTDQKKVAKPAGLQTYLEAVPGYQASANSPLAAATYSFLELDDYIQTSYRNDRQTVSLYIGYYFTLDKVSAAHSPLVCFPGQGWTLTTPSQQRLEIGQHVVNYEEMTATLDAHQELVLYWYQAQDKTVTEIYRNKFNALLNQLTGDKQEHAFVRVTIPLGKTGLEEARIAGREFISAFYPLFLTYVNSVPRFTQETIRQ